MAVRDCYVSMGCHVSIIYQLNTLVLLHEQPKRQAQHCSRTCDDGVFGTAGPKADSSFSKKMNEVIIEVYGMSTCIHEYMTAIYR